MSTPLTIVYKTVKGLQISLDLYLPQSPKNAPVLLWWHGGGLLQGTKAGLTPHLRQSVDKYSHAVISADYRLAPQVGIREIWEDVRDCVSFIRDINGLAKHAPSGALDTTKLAVSGSSAGGYLAFLAGLYCEPKPNVILPIYPITDPLGYFFTNSQPFPLLKPPGQVHLTKKITAADIGEFLDPKADAVASCERESPRSSFYFYMMDQGNLAQLLGLNTGVDRYRDADNDRWRIAKAIPSRALPPTYVVHGDVDRAVGVEQADEAVGVMTGLGMTVKYDRLAGVDHLFDVSESIELNNMYEFMHKHLADSKL